MTKSITTIASIISGDKDDVTDSQTDSKAAIELENSGTAKAKQAMKEFAEDNIIWQSLVSLVRNELGSDEPSAIL